MIKSRIVSDPTKLVELLLARGADPSVRNNDDRTVFDEAVRRAGQVAETYYPRQPIGLKKLEGVLELLRNWTG